MHMEDTQMQKQGIHYASSISVLSSGMQYDEVGAINEVETEQNPIAYCFSKNITPTYGLHVRSAKCSHNQSFLQL